jgi:hypothetical protein
MAPKTQVAGSRGHWVKAYWQIPSNQYRSQWFPRWGLHRPMQGQLNPPRAAGTMACARTTKLARRTNDANQKHLDVATAPRYSVGLSSKHAGCRSCPGDGGRAETWEIVDDIGYRLARALLPAEIQNKCDRILIDAPPKFTPGRANGFSLLEYSCVRTIFAQLAVKMEIRASRNNRK